MFVSLKRRWPASCIERNITISLETATSDERGSIYVKYYDDKCKSINYHRTELFECSDELSVLTSTRFGIASLSSMFF
jgi:hypothetical protein